LNSPRSLEACRRQGIEPSELVHLSLNDFKDTLPEKNIDKESLKAFWNHYKEKRTEKFQVVREVNYVKIK